jgi:predicted ester cyclase
MHHRRAEVPMSIETNKQITRELVAAHERKDVARIQEILSPKLVWHVSGSPTSMGRDEYLEGIEMGARAFSEIKLTIDQSIAEGDLVANLMTVRMRHTGPFQGLAPTNRPLSFASMWMYRIIDGRVVEAWMLEEDFVRSLG